MMMTARGQTQLEKIRVYRRAPAVPVTTKKKKKKKKKKWIRFIHKAIELIGFAGVCFAAAADTKLSPERISLCC